MNLARALPTAVAAVLLPCFARLAPAQDPAPVPAVVPPAARAAEPLPQVRELIERAQRAAAERVAQDKPLCFEGRFEVRAGKTVSQKGRARVWGPRDFRFECDLPNGPILIRYRFASDAERVLWHLQQFDVKGQQEALIGQGFRAESWKDAPADARRALMGLIFLFASEPALLLETAAARWADLKVVGASRDEDGTDVWRMEAALPPHEVPEAFRLLALARVRLQIGREDLVLRRHELLHANGEVYKSNRLSGLRFRAPEGERPPRIEVPPEFEVGPMLTPEERGGG